MDHLTDAVDSYVPQSEQRAAQRNTPGAIAPALALQTVVLFTISDAFGLVPEEIIWAEEHLGGILEPLLDKRPSNVPLAVRQEMLTSSYTRTMERLIATNTTHDFPAYDPHALNATATDWATVLMQLVTGCYTLRPLDESAMYGKLLGLLRELGVSNPANPRAARYLPNDVKHRLNQPD